MPTLSKPKRLADAYRFPGFRPRAMLRGVFGDRKGRVITLVRHAKRGHARPRMTRVLRNYSHRVKFSPYSHHRLADVGAVEYS